MAVLFILCLGDKNMTTVNYNIRLDKELRDQAFSVLDSYGLPPSQAIKIFLKQIAKTNSIPLSFDYAQIPQNPQNDQIEQNELIPNEETRQAMFQSREDYLNGKLTRYKTADDAMKAMEEIACG